MLVRLAMIFALCDLHTRIDVQHIQAAMGWIRHGAESAKFVFLKATKKLFDSSARNPLISVGFSFIALAFGFGEHGGTAPSGDTAFWGTESGSHWRNC